MKVILHDLPGGPEAFELMSSFCYNNGRAPISPSNVCLLHVGGHYMEMTDEVAPCNLIKQTDRFLETMIYWTWPEIFVAIKQCYLRLNGPASSMVLKKCIDGLLQRIASTSDMCTSGSSPESSNFRFSCDTKSSESAKYSFRPWWFKDLSLLSPNIIETIVQTMISRNFDQLCLAKFLFFCVTTRFAMSNSVQKRDLVETVVRLLYLLERRSVSCKGLFGILRVSSNIGISKSCRYELETMIGSLLDQATMDNLLFPSPPGSSYLYDVNLVSRFLKSFLSSHHVSLTGLKTVGSLMDKYITEVAPDSNLRPAKFVALIKALPDAAIDSYDGIYRALDMYFEVHGRLSEEEKIKICIVLNYEKLSLEACKHLAQNSKFPSRTALQALVSQQCKLKSLLSNGGYLKSGSSSPCIYRNKGIKGVDNYSKEQIVFYAKKVDLSTENEELRAHLNGMQLRVMELEKICRKMQIQMSKIVKKTLPSPGSGGSLPKLCS
ncbi:hypothetical protein AMTR_s00043p00168880 [Amborella trichopoda]|uniref:NPH3 domain-containing protein n=2 Tax=Amborella trichopoda TaxID=13333 RepID=W1PXX8_AMBTC|nr:hypothetical protein AMTR_s00043p00168880 [Amborella trichopoda]